MKCLIPIILYHVVEGVAMILLAVAMLGVALMFRHPKKRGS